MDLEIKYKDGQGHMLIHMDAFFPTSQVRFKKLLKIIQMDFYHRDELKEVLEKYFIEKINELEETRIRVGKKHLDYKQKFADQERLVDSGKFPNGVMLTREQYIQAKEDLKQYKKIVTSTLSEFKRTVRQKEQFTKHLEILKEGK